VLGSPQASSMASRMRETGIEPAIEEVGAGVSPEREVISSGRNGSPLYARRQAIGWQAQRESSAAG
jgi:hypothetical protein